MAIIVKPAAQLTHLLILSTLYQLYLALLQLKKNLSITFLNYPNLPSFLNNGSIVAPSKKKLPTNWVSG